MSQRPLPPCGIYRTTAPIGDVPAERLVYFHNHGNPSAGVYQPREWKGNRAHFHEQGTPLPSHELAANLHPLAAEGFYRVVEAFFCCAKRCREYGPDDLVQLGYDVSAAAILFTPEVLDGALVVPDRGMRIDAERINKLRLLNVPVSSHGDQGDDDERATIH